jgi:hypothetical protein
MIHKSAHGAMSPSYWPPQVVHGVVNKFLTGDEPAALETAMEAIRSYTGHLLPDRWLAAALGAPGRGTMRAVGVFEGRPVFQLGS